MSAFPSFVTPRYPQRQWGLVGFPGSGKSTFLAQMRQPLLVVDADGRFAEVAARCENPLSLSNNPNHHRDPLEIANTLQHKDLTGIGTLVIDSITPILRLCVAMAMEGNAQGKNKNKASAFAKKANAVRLIQDSVVRPGVDSCIVWHYEKGRDSNGREQSNQSMSRLERERLVRSMNAVIELIKRADGVRVARVVWSRTGKKGIEVPDTEGFWKDVPQRIEQAIYGASESTNKG